MVSLGCRVETSSGGYAFRLDDWDVDYYINHEPSEIAMVGNFGNPFKSRMDKALSAMKNNGELEPLKSTWWQEAALTPVTFIDQLWLP